MLVTVTNEPSGAVDVETLVRKAGVEIKVWEPIVTGTEVCLDRVVLGCTVTVLVEGGPWIPPLLDPEEAEEYLKSGTVVVVPGRGNEVIKESMELETNFTPGVEICVEGVEPETNFIPGVEECIEEVELETEANPKARRWAEEEFVCEEGCTCEEGCMCEEFVPGIAVVLWTWFCELVATDELVDETVVGDKDEAEREFECVPDTVAGTELLTALLEL
jgi:hypothetical protein